MLDVSLELVETQQWAKRRIFQFIKAVAVCLPNLSSTSFYRLQEIPEVGSQGRLLSDNIPCYHPLWHYSVPCPLFPSRHYWSDFACITFTLKDLYRTVISTNSCHIAGLSFNSQFKHFLIIVKPFSDSLGPLGGVLWPQTRDHCAKMPQPWT